MNSFMTGLRQVSNNPAAFDTTLKATDSPKLQRMLKDIHDASEKDPNFRSVVYSNFLESGVEPLVSSLGEKGVTSAAFTGELNDKRRRQTVEDYNTGKLKVLGLSPAGGEGLDLKGTKMVQLSEEHWNPERGRQAIGRAARYKSHAHLPEAERNVSVRRYLSVHPKKGLLKRIFTGPQETSADEWINKRRQEKLQLNQQFVEAIPSFTPPPAPKPTPPVISSPTVMTGVSTPG
jgi:SNF2 family DNA or RNA helicase